MSYVSYFHSGVTGPLDTLTGNVGGVVSPDGAANINILGTGGVTVTGTPVTNTLTISVAGLTVPEGGTGLTTITDHSLLVGSGVAALTELGVATDGQLVIGSTGADPVLATLSSIGGTIGITNAAGSISLDVIPGSAVISQLDGDTGTAVPTLGVVDVLGGVNITTAGALSAITVSLHTIIDQMDGVDFANNGRLATDTGAGDNFYIQAYDVDGTSYTTFATLTANNTPTMDLSDDVTKSGGYIYRAGGTDVPVSDGGTGLSTLTDHGILLGSGAAAITPLGVASDGQIPIGSTGADPVLANITSSGATIAITNGAGTINLEAGGSVMTGLDADSGSAVPTAGIIDIEGGDNITTSAIGTNVLTVDLDAAISGTSSLTMATGGSIRTNTGAGNTVLFQAYDVDGAVYSTFATMTAANDPSMNLADNVTKGGGYIYRAGGTDVPVTDGGTGVSTLTDHGVVVGSGTSPVTSLAAATDGQLIIGSTGADPAVAALSSSRDLLVTNGAGTIDLTLTENTHDTAIHGWDGSIIETIDVDVTSNGTVITLSVEQSGGGDLTVVFSTDFYDWDTTPADTVTLTAGSDTSPQINYVYFLESSKTLTASTASFPAGVEYAPIATVLCQSAASLQTDGAYKVHVWTDHISSSTNNGHIGHLNAWIRNQNATWISGVGQTLTITPNGGAPDNVIFTTAAGVALQLHDHTFPAFSGTPDLYTVNDSATPYNKITDLNALLTDSTGASMSAKYFSLVIWGVVSEDTGDCKLMVNLPGGSYNTQSGVELDASRYADYSIPSDFKGTGFLISELKLRHQTAASGTWTSIDEVDLRGLFPSLAAGGGTSFPTEFADNTFRIFDEGDDTKELAFQVSGITTSTTRTITMDDRDIDMDAVPDTFATDGASATPAAGSVTIAGGTNIATSGAGSTVTVAFDGTLPVASGGTGATTLTDHGALIGSGTGAITAASVGTNGQVFLGATGADPAFATLTSNNSTISFTAGANSLAIDTAGTVCVAVDGDSGTAVPSAGSLIIAGGTNVTTSATGQTVTINASASGGGISWNEVTGTSQSMSVDNGYITNNAGLVTATLPSTASVGEIVRVIGLGAGGWKIAQNASQYIRWDESSVTTTGTSGYLESTDDHDAVELICTVTNNGWSVLSSKGNITIV